MGSPARIAGCGPADYQLGADSMDGLEVLRLISYFAVKK